MTEISKLNETELDTELKSVTAEIALIKEQLKPLESRKKDIQSAIENIAKQKLLDNGAEKELIEFYKVKVPEGKGDDYMSWCISRRGLEIFEYYVNIDYWDRYRTYNFLDELTDAFADKDWEEDELEVRAEIISDFLNNKLMNYKGLTEDEIKVIKDYIECVKGMTCQRFLFDW